MTPPVDGGRKSMTHPAEPPTPQRSAAAAAAAAGDGSVLQAGPGRTGGEPEDRKKPSPPENLSKVEAPLAQGQSWVLLVR